MREAERLFAESWFAASNWAIRAFDFWIGEWRVIWKTPEGQPAEGHNSIGQVLDGCAIEKNRQGGNGSAGKSLTFFDPHAKRWHQTWIYDTGQPRTALRKARAH